MERLTTEEREMMAELVQLETERVVRNMPWVSFSDARGVVVSWLCSEFSVFRDSPFHVNANEAMRWFFA